ncbi:hypothetical protein ACIBCA_20325 [Kitasatospora sp. NPDC051170]|uniref:hypothetical protein n=1 Tax=Kitasatospora sp. NPDC051170 TaxID=3364056 RepID=UPI0037AA9276
MMITDDGLPERELVLQDGLDLANISRAHRAALEVLRYNLDTVRLDALSDRPWPDTVVPAHRRALALGRAQAGEAGRHRGDPASGISIDTRDDAQFALLLALAPHTIGAEGWRAERLIFSACDSGTSLWLAVTAHQHERLQGRLRAYCLPETAFSVLS